MKALSCWARTVIGHYPFRAFAELHSGCTPEPNDILAFIRTNIIEGIPRVFARHPIVFDRLRCYAAQQLNVFPEQVCMTGSAKLGFSLKPKKWLQHYSPRESDLDIFVISECLFDQFCNDYTDWTRDYNDKVIVPCDANEESTWTENFRCINRSISRGFVDHYLIPTRYERPYKCEIVCNNLPVHINSLLVGTGISVRRKPGSIRVYKNTSSAIQQLSITLTDAIRKATPQKC